MGYEPRKFDSTITALNPVDIIKSASSKATSRMMGRAESQLDRKQEDQSGSFQLTVMRNNDPLICSSGRQNEDVSQINIKKINKHHLSDQLDVHREEGRIKDESQLSPGNRNPSLAQHQPAVPPKASLSILRTIAASDNRGRWEDG